MDTMNTKLEPQTMSIENAIRFNLRTVPLPLSDKDRAGIDCLLRWQHQGTTHVTVNM